MRLYNFDHSTCAWRVRIALALKGIDVELMPVDVSAQTRAQDEPQFAAINPLRQVPCLEWQQDGTTRRLAQSVAIIEWLDQRHPNPPLLPMDPYAAAKVREMVQIINAGVQPLQNNRVLANVDALGGSGRTWAQSWIVKGLVALEAVARPLAGRYLFGDFISMADIFLVPQLFNARRFEIDMSRLSTLERVDKACAQEPQFLAAHPDRQPPVR